MNNLLMEIAGPFLHYIWLVVKIILCLDLGIALFGILVMGIQFIKYRVFKKDKKRD